MDIFLDISSVLSASHTEGAKSSIALLWAPRSRAAPGNVCKPGHDVTVMLVWGTWKSGLHFAMEENKRLFFLHNTKGKHTVQLCSAVSQLREEHFHQS